MAQTVRDKRKKPGMVHWYHPVKLAETGLYAFLSTFLGSMIDTRRLLPFEAPDEECITDYGNAEELWIDYAADIGDGWDATYTMAYLFSSPELTPQSGERLPRGHVLILGGDEVYPQASKWGYAQRLVWPFNQAARNLGQKVDDKAVTGEHLRDIYCVPGNHDWYDGLAAFTRRFCNGRQIGSFQTRQRRSYFVLKLPYGWQLWGIDIQLSDDIDVAQFNFFRHHAESLKAGARVILCLAEPDWVYGEQAGEALHWNVERFERMVEAHGGRVVLELAGDIHNYQRYEGTRNPGGGYESYPQTKLVSGGGGAFLHPNHTFPLEKQVLGGFTCKDRYPDARTTWKLSFGNLFFAFKNWEMAGLLGLVYLLFFWSAPPKEFTRMFPIEHPGAFLLMILLFCALYAFTNCTSRLFKVLWGLIHTAAHIVGALLTWSWVTGLFPDTWIYPARAGVLVVGALVGGTIFGLYLLLSLSLFKIHENEAFSSLRIDNYKHFLRLHLTADGLRLYVIAVDKTAAERDSHPVPAWLFEKLAIQ